MRYYQIARIVNTFGIRGEIKVISDTDFPEERFKEGEILTITQDDQPIQQVTVESARQHKGTYIIKLQEFNSVNDVEKFKNTWLSIQSSQQHELDDDEYYHHEIIGLNVYTTEAMLLGTIKEILALGSNDVWVVDRAHNNKPDALIPFIKDVVKEVDLKSEKVVVELMEGLIEDED